MHGDLSSSVAKGGIGILGSFLAAVSAQQEQAAWALGFLVGAATLVNIGFDLRRKWRDRNE